MDQETDARLAKIVQANWSDPIAAKVVVDGLSVPLNKQEVLSILLKANRRDLANVFIEMSGSTERTALEDFVWSNTRQDYRHTYQGKRAVTYMGKSGTVLAALESMSDAVLTKLATMKGWKAPVVARPGIAKAAEDLAYEGGDVGVAISDRPPHIEADVYHPLANIGKRGATVEVIHYSLWAPDSRTAWGATLKHRLKAKKGASIDEVMRIIRSTFQEAERESIQSGAKYPTKMSEPSKRQVKGIDKSLPDPSTVEKPQDKSGHDVSVRFKKPNIWVHSKQDSASVEGSREEVYLTVNWAFAKKVNRLADDLIKLTGLKAAQSFLESNSVKVKYNRYIDPMWA